MKPAQGALINDVVEGKIPEDTPADGDVQVAADTPPEIATPAESKNAAKDSGKETRVETKDNSSSKGFIGRFLPSKTKQAKVQAEPSVNVRDQQSHEAQTIAA